MSHYSISIIYYYEKQGLSSLKILWDDLPLCRERRIHSLEVDFIMTNTHPFRLLLFFPKIICSMGTMTLEDNELQHWWVLWWHLIRQ